MFNEKFNKPNPIFQILLLLFLSQTLLSQKIYTSTEAINHIGEFSSRGNIFLNIVGIYPDNPFTAYSQTSNPLKAKPSSSQDKSNSIANRTS
jgi:hypothetical protein